MYILHEHAHCYFPTWPSPSVASFPSSGERGPVSQPWTIPVLVVQPVSQPPSLCCHPKNVALIVCPSSSGLWRQWGNTVPPTTETALCLWGAQLGVSTSLVMQKQFPKHMSVGVIPACDIPVLQDLDINYWIYYDPRTQEAKKNIVHVQDWLKRWWKLGFIASWLTLVQCWVTLSPVRWSCWKMALCSVLIYTFSLLSLIFFP